MSVVPVPPEAGSAANSLEKFAGQPAILAPPGNLVLVLGRLSFA